MAKKTKKNNETYLMSQEYRNQYPSSNVPISGRKFYNMPSFDNQGNKIDSNKQETIGGELPFQTGFNPARLSISNRAAMADGGLMNQYFGENSTLNKYINKGKSFLGLDSDVSDSPNVIAANKKGGGAGNSSSQSVYSQRITDQNDITSENRGSPISVANNPTSVNNVEQTQSAEIPTSLKPESLDISTPSRGKSLVYGKNKKPSNTFSVNTPNMQNEITKQKSGMEKTFEDSNNKTTSSRRRGGLFTNYGKDVEIRKTFDESTGRTNKQKFVDGELTRDRNSRQDLKRKRRSSDAKSKRKAGRNK